MFDLFEGPETLITRGSESSLTTRNYLPTLFLNLRGSERVVVERVRPPGETEHQVFYCEGCGELVHDMEFDCKDIVDHFRQAMEEQGAQPEREPEPPVRRGLQPKPPIGRRGEGEGLHVDVVA